MSKRIWIRSVGLAVLAGAWLTACGGGEAPPPAPAEKAPAGKKAEKAEEKAPVTPPTEEEMNAAMMKAATPGDQHKALEAMAGNWDVACKMWMQPGAEPVLSNGKAVMEMVLGGRYIQQKFNGDIMGQPFEGWGYTGYENVRGKWVGSWMDTMCTGPMASEGDRDAEGKWTFTGTSVDPISGKMVEFTENMWMPDADTIVFEMIGPDMAGNVYKMMELTYTRAK